MQVIRLLHDGWFTKNLEAVFKIGRGRAGPLVLMGEIPLNLTSLHHEVQGLQSSSLS